MSGTLDLLERLIGFDTQSFRSNLELVGFVRDHLAGLGVESRILPDSTGTKANLWAVIGPPGVPGLVLSGHTDVVPVAGQAWTGDPFRARLVDGRVLGRGAADMKGYLACVLALVPELVAARLERPAILAFSYDEEVGCKGVPALIEAILAELPRPEACLVGEPTLMGLVDGHKGKAGYRCTVTGREAHSAYPALGANAVIAAARIIGHIAGMGEAFAAHGPFADGFDPPHHTSGVGRIEGGSQLNIIPNHCSFELEFRTLPAEDPMRFVREVEAFARTHVLPRLRTSAPEAEIRFEEVLAYPGMSPPPDSRFTRLCRELTGTDRPTRVAFGTEGGCFDARGIPSLVCGPGDIKVAHKPDEWIAVEQLERCDAFLRRLVGAMLAG
ncbi:MAG: acetylornithine deacetylase [Geminicoccaceae bacterium]